MASTLQGMSVASGSCLGSPPVSGPLYIALAAAYTCWHQRHPCPLKTTRHCFPHQRALLIAGGQGCEVKAKVLVFLLADDSTAWRGGTMCRL